MSVKPGTYGYKKKGKQYLVPQPSWCPWRVQVNLRYSCELHEQVAPCEDAEEFPDHCSLAKGSITVRKST